MRIFTAGDRIGGYELLEFCGKGGFGEVWLVRGFDGGRASLKLIRTEDGRSWERELAGLRAWQSQVAPHPNLIRIFHAAQEPGFLYYTMEAADTALPGRYIPLTLARKLKTGRLSASETLTLLESLLDGLEQLHKAGLVHRDIKPENILFVDGIPKLADLSLIRDPARSASPGGTPGFLPPEMSGSPSDDCYALCMSGYCAVTGLSPFDFPRKPDDMPLSEYAAVRRVLIAGCNRDPRRRFHSAAEMRLALRGGGKCSPYRRPFPGIVVAVLLSAGALLIAAFLLYSGEGAGAPRPVAPTAPSATPPQDLPSDTVKMVSEEEIAQFEESCRAMADMLKQSTEYGSFHRERDLAAEARWRSWLLRAGEIRELPPAERAEPWQSLMAEIRQYTVK